MSKKLACTLAMAMMVTTGFAQTKRVAHGSHSGSYNGFVATASDNFGLSPQMACSRDSLAAARKKQDSIKAVQYRDSLNKAHGTMPKKGKRK